MHQRTTSPNTSTTIAPSSSPSHSSGSPQSDTSNARLVAFCSTSSPCISSPHEIEHLYVPRPPLQSELIFESCLVVFKIISLFLHYLLIYKSEKWIGPFQSPSDAFIHWHRIDGCVMGILIIFCLAFHVKLVALRILINIIAFVYSIWFYSWKYVLVFTYPLVCSLLVYHDQSYKSSKTQVTSVSSTTLPGHWCSTNACDLRFETDCLRADFNQRIRHILFSSFLSFYYICIVPLAFSDTHHIRLDIVLLLRYGFSLFLSLILIYTSHYLPLELLTVLHRNGKHLGSWHCLTSHHHPSMLSTWDEKTPTAYEPNSLVKYKRHIYRSSNHWSTVAEPGNMYHTRFAILFSRPFIFPLILCSLQVMLFLFQLVSLLFDQRWFVALSQMTLFVLNTYTIRHTTRDMYLLYLVYR